MQSNSTEIHKESSMAHAVLQVLPAREAPCSSSCRPEIRFPCSSMAIAYGCGLGACQHRRAPDRLRDCHVGASGVGALGGATALVSDEIRVGVLAGGQMMGRAGEGVGLTGAVRRGRELGWAELLAVSYGLLGGLK